MYQGGVLDEVALPELPPSSGSDPFDGIAYLTQASSSKRIKVDTESKTLRMEQLDSDTSVWEGRDVVRYSYRESGTGTIVSFVYDKKWDHSNEELCTPQEYYGRAESEFKADIKADTESFFEDLQGLPDDEKNAAIDELIAEAADAGVELTRADCASAETYCDKVFASDSFKATVAAYLQREKGWLERLGIYLVEVGEKTESAEGVTATITVAGQYNSDMPWHKQGAGCFELPNDSNSASYGYIYSSTEGGTIYLYESSARIGQFSIDSVDDSNKTMSGTYRDETKESADGEESSEPLTVNYREAGTNEGTVITVNIKNQNLDFRWQPSTELDF